MSIRDNVLKVKREMLLEVDQPPIRSPEVQRHALAAIKDGQGSEAWRAYMSLFIDEGNTGIKQLARLLGKDSTQGMADMNRARAYLVADGTCGIETVTNFGKNASLLLDQGVEQEEPVPID